MLKHSTTLYSMILLCIATTRIIGMDNSLALKNDRPAADQKTPLLLRVLNKTPHKVLVRFQFQEEQPVAFTLIEDQAITVPYTTRLILFKVGIYGKYKKWLNVEMFTLGWYQPPNNADEIRKGLSKSNYLQVRVRLGGVYWDNDLLRSIAGECVPYTYHYEEYDPRACEDIQKRECLLDIFPQVKYARNNGSEILPRYVLCVPEGASDNDLLATYGLLERSIRQDLSLPPRASTVLIQLLRAASRAIQLGDTAGFVKMVDESRLISLSGIEAGF